MNSNDKCLQEFDNVLTYVSRELRLPLLKLPNSKKTNINEIRLRRGQPIELVMGIHGEIMKWNNEPLISTRRDIETTFELLCSRSVYAVTEEIAQGFVTIPNGHRAGICGHAVVKSGQISTLKDISSINIRISREIKGASDRIMPFIFKEGQVLNTIVVSPPGCGKTTLLRDIARQLSSGNPELGVSTRRVGISDERGEIAAIRGGISRYDLGPRCDVIDGCSKGDGLMMLIRTMSPQVVIADEISGSKDCEGIKLASRCGVSVICSAHGSSMDDLMGNSNIHRLICEGVFSVAIFLDAQYGLGRIKSIEQIDKENIKKFYAEVETE